MRWLGYIKHMGRAIGQGIARFTYIANVSVKPLANLTGDSEAIKPVVSFEVCAQYREPEWGIFRLYGHQNSI